ncbi:hypothetical protein GN956_G18901 [Arapaima gigas]
MISVFFIISTQDLSSGLGVSGWRHSERRDAAEDEDCRHTHEDSQSLVSQIEISVPLSLRCDLSSSLYHTAMFYLFKTFLLCFLYGLF